MMKKHFTVVCAVSILSLSLTGCWGKEAAEVTLSTNVPAAGAVSVAGKPAAAEQFTFDVDPETFAIVITKDGVRIPASVPLPKAAVSNVIKSKDAVQWTYPNQVNVSVVKKNDYLDIRIESIGAEQFQWPSVQSENYILPFGEGKRVPANDANWRDFLKDQTLTWSESF
ncbi:hypothetical protein [Paenibacillus ferrarius]|uniref:hypothetical protein n=1 Tax=Paenibacillus ferrarius TaxID=1469647 RepID=UPI003D277F2E